MPLPNSPWNSSYPASQDNLPVDQPDQVPDSTPGALDGNRILVSHLHVLRDKLDAVALKVGDNSDLPAGSHGARLTALEAAGSGGQTNTVVGSSGITNVGDNVDANMAPTYGSSASTVCEGNDSRLSDARTPTGAASGDLGGTYPGPSVAAITTTTGPTSLVVGAVADGEYLVRSGATLIGGSPSGASPLTTKGDLYTYDTGDQRLPVGTDGHVLTADSAEATGIKWAAASGGGGGGFDREQVYTAASSPQETFTLSTAAATNANNPSGYSVRVYVNGLKHKYSVSPGAREFDIVSATQIRVGGLNISDDVEIVYGV